MIRLLFLLFAVSSVQAGTVKLSWDASPTQACTATITTDCVAGYDLYYGIDNINLTTLIDVGNVTTHTLNNVTEGVRYYYALKSYNTDHSQTSVFSNIVSSVAFSSASSNVLGGIKPINFGNDGEGVELGVKFKPIVDGKILALKAYIPEGFTGNRSVSLWDSTGVLMGTATLADDGFTNAWVSIPFETPVSVIAGTQYVASFYSPNGLFAYESNGFSTPKIANNLYFFGSNEIDGGNGVYSYSLASVFPTSSYNATNYFVDVVFERNAPLPITSYVPPVGLKAWYKLNGNLNDEFGNHGISNGSTMPLFQSDPESSKTVAYFDGIDDIVTVPYDSLINLKNGSNTQFTVSVWHKPNSIMTSSKALLWRYTDLPNYLNVWGVYANYTSSGGPMGGFSHNTTGGYYSVKGATTPSLGIWQHLALTYDSITGIQRLYIDGALAVTTQRTAGTQIVTSLGTLNIGGSFKFTPGGDHYNGWLRDVMIFNRSLDATEISNIYLQS